MGCVGCFFFKQKTVYEVRIRDWSSDGCSSDLWCSRKEIDVTTNEEMVKHPRVVERYQQEANHFNGLFGQWEQIKKFALLPAEWSVDGGHLTPKLDVKRPVIIRSEECRVGQEGGSTCRSRWARLH